MVQPDLGSWRIRAAIVAVLVGAVVVALIVMNRPTWEARQIVLVEGERSSDELAVTVAHLRCRSDPRIRIAETEEAVRLRAEQDVTGDCDAVGLESTSTVTVASPVGRRAVVVEDVPGQPGSVRCNTDDHDLIICR
jgi:hypothetical protein